MKNTFHTVGTLVCASSMWLVGCADVASKATSAQDESPLPTPSGVAEQASVDADAAIPDQLDSARRSTFQGLPCAPGSRDSALVASHALGGFSVQVSSDRALSVTHQSEGSRVLFATAAGSPVELAQTELEVTDHQGSFKVEENVGTACKNARFEQARTGDGTLALTGKFDDTSPACSALRFELTFCERQAGHLGFELTSNDASFDLVVLRAASDEGERIYGMGEQAPHDTLNLKGRAIEVLAQEGGIGRGHIPITPAVNLASSGSGGSESSTYYAAPHYLTSRQRSLFLENTEYAVFDLRNGDVNAIRLFGPSMRGRILQGSSPLQLIERFTEYAGRMPALPEWVNQGAIVALAKDPAASAPIVAALRKHGVELAGIWNQTWSGVSRTFVGEQVLWNWIQNPNSRPGWQPYVDDLERQGTRVLCYVNPMFRDVPPEAGTLRRNLFQEGIAGDYFVHKADGSVYMLPITAFDVGLLDLTNEAARRWMKDIIQEELLAEGRCSGWMADFAEALPYDAVLASGESAETYHNTYPVEWARLNREAIEEVGMLGDVLIYNRSGHTRSPAHALLFWQGDQLTTWDKYDGLASALQGLISGGLSGLSLNHSDVGGYTSLSRLGLGYKRETELLKRWSEMNAFTAVLRTHEGNQPGDNPQVYSDDSTLAHFARMSKVYKALAFYRTQLFSEASERGWPLVRHLMLHYPDDTRAHEVSDQFMLGSEFLVAPVKNKCWTAPFCPYNKNVYLPAGRWVHLWTGKVYGSATRGSDVSVKAPIGQPAVFYREGSSVGARFVNNLNAAGISATRPR